MVYYSNTLRFIPPKIRTRKGLFMATDYKWDQYSDRYMRNYPKNDEQKALAEHQADNVVKQIMGRVESEQHFGKMVLRKLAPHVLKAMDRPQPKDEDESEDRGETLV
jgi:hypothetical protein